MHPQSNIPKKPPWATTIHAWRHKECQCLWVYRSCSQWPWSYLSQLWMHLTGCQHCKKAAPAIVLLLCFLQTCIKFETPSTLITCLRSRAILKYKISECQLLLFGGNRFGKEQFWYLFLLYWSCCWVTILRVLRHHLHSVLLGFGWTNIKGEFIILEGDCTESTSIVSPFSVTNRSMEYFQWCQTTTVLCSWVK